MVVNRALGMSAATALLTGFLLSPLTQGAITYPTRVLEGRSGTATIARSESYSHPTPYDRLDMREKQAIQLGIYHASDAEVPPLQPICSSGDCRWQNFSSLAVCAAVADVSDRLTVSDRTRPENLGVSLGDANSEPVRAARLPNGLFLVGGSASCNLNISWPHPPVSGGSEEVTNEGSFLPSNTSLAFSDTDGRVTSAIANFFLVYTNGTTTSSISWRQQEQEAEVFRATEVLLHFCVNTYEASTSRGESTSRVVFTSTLAAEDEAAGSGKTSVNVRDSLSSLSSSSTGGEGGGVVYSVKKEDVALLKSYILSVFSGVYSGRYGPAISGQTPTSEVLGLAMFPERDPPYDDAQMRAVVGNVTANVATSLTNTQIALAVSFLLGIMVQTAVWDVKILKGSPTAALLAISADEKAYLESREDMFLDSSGQEREATRKMKSIACRFRSGGNGWELELGKREDG
ncbi:hypothetical protein C7999DRAFT_26947 [Corynascus novoguineensis]|uniref:Uncharacterized protein n=1 Tax=Corynascus novoguineensis TaxID=1126955 RepID=A0AAN7D1E7_9PEZI|nr:hypothetical protein C7999DRAFT_26947 [Corynascus novoguineensis]